jgi:hypothetical protein
MRADLTLSLSSALIRHNRKKLLARSVPHQDQSAVIINRKKRSQALMA